MLKIPDTVPFADTAASPHLQQQIKRFKSLRRNASTPKQLFNRRTRLLWLESELRTNRHCRKKSLEIYQITRAVEGQLAGKENTDTSRRKKSVLKVYGERRSYFGGNKLLELLFWKMTRFSPLHTSVTHVSVAARLNPRASNLAGNIKNKHLWKEEKVQWKVRRWAKDFQEK